MLEVNSREDNPETKMEAVLMSKRNQLLRKWMKEGSNLKTEEDFRQICLEMSRLAHQRRISIATNKHRII